MTRALEVDVAKLRERLGWSQGQLARFLGVSDRSIYRWETGERHTKASAGLDWLRLLDSVTKVSVVRDRVREAQARGENMLTLVARALEGGEHGDGR